MYKLCFTDHEHHDDDLRQISVRIYLETNHWSEENEDDTSESDCCDSVSGKSVCFFWWVIISHIGQLEV